MKRQPPPEFKSIAEFWAAYVKTAMPTDAPPIQLQECRRAFYAGALSMFNGAVMAVGGPEVPEGVGELYLASIDDELKAFYKAVDAGHA